MPGGTKRLWGTGRRLVGNVLPLLIGAPFLVYGAMKFPAEGFQGQAAAAIVAFPVALWLATNFLGLVGGIGLKREIERRLHLERPFDRTEKFFVGFARPSYSSLLDPHEDVGFLIVHPDSLEFFGADVRAELARSSVDSVSFRPNPHTWAGLGRWISVDGKVDEASVRLLLEPRSRATLLGNRAEGKRLRARLQNWLKG